MPDPTAEPPPVQTLPRAEAPRCAECDAPVSGAHCAACGQKTGALRQPVHHFVRNSVSEFFGLDGRVWRTSAALLFTPGTLTRAYNAGQRQRYLSPLRVYLTSTLLFFFLLSTIDPVGRLGETMEGASRDSSSAVTVTRHLAENDSIVAGGIYGEILRRALNSGTTVRHGDSLSMFSTEAQETVTFSVASFRDSVVASPDTLDPKMLARAQLRLKRARVESAILRTMPPDSLVYTGDIHDATTVLYPDTVSAVDGPEWLQRSEAVRLIQSEQTSSSQTAAVLTFIRSSIGYVPTVMFLLLPLFALLMKALYMRREWFYSEHVVFGLHTHAYAFVAFAAITVVTWIGDSKPWSWQLVLALSLSIPVYFFAAQKRVYGQGWRKTFTKAALLGTVYSFSLLFGLIGAVFLAAVIG